MKPDNLSAPASRVISDPWSALRVHTAARIAPGRAGGSMPTAPQLTFAYDQALARDAVHAPFESAALAAELRAAHGAVFELVTEVTDRATYLRRPDLGCRLSEESVATLAAAKIGSCDVALIVSDGLSACAAHRQAAPLLAALCPLLRSAGLTIGPICVVHHARVGLLDEIGAALNARLAMILLGERPGLGAPDSLGAYFEFGPRAGRTNAERNCVSNIRPEGLPPARAAATLARLIQLALEGRASGVGLKDDGGDRSTPLQFGN